MGQNSDFVLRACQKVKYRRITHTGLSSPTWLDDSVKPPSSTLIFTPSSFPLQSHHDSGNSHASQQAEATPHAHGGVLLGGSSRGILGGVAKTSGGQVALEDVHLGLTGIHVHGDVAGAVGGGGGAANDLHNSVTGAPATNAELVLGAGAALIDNARDNLVAGGALDLAQVVVVGEEGLGLGGDVGGVGSGGQVDHGVADLVEGLGQDVQLGGGVVAGRPEDLTVSRNRGASEVLLLALVD